MIQNSSIAKGALAAAAAVVALAGVVAAPSAASAQPYGASYYDPCRRDETNRGTTGALLGGALGAVIGSNAAARNARTEGALLGGALGAVAGGVVGNNSAACRNGGYQPRSSYNNGYYNGNTSYYNNYNNGSPYYTDSRYPDRRYDNDNRYGYSARYDNTYAYDRYGDRFAVSDRPVGSDGCTLAESPIYLPDGQVEKRFVRVCQDRSGRYQVVD
ncbi:glycine zipper 2TM domain-containing protein [Phenylobacterium sp.]|uniref:glycine zipper 2TM domain-containing protein n=1 Tax=Phenylobacterium sp. TaxID=1871053 RepID=UPI00273397A7|nr:glycine zipper 2TM domain-containing protein [Phenylobacterium sp.]MDP3659674.1 glycine zipper 2TM domain-containing protein [Phenylobacterium sp.]